MTYNLLRSIERYKEGDYMPTISIHIKDKIYLDLVRKGVDPKVEMRKLRDFLYAGGVPEHHELLKKHQQLEAKFDELTAAYRAMRTRYESAHAQLENLQRKYKETGLKSPQESAST